MRSTRNKIYEIQCLTGKERVGGDIVGAFGVANAATEKGWFRVTHLFTGLAIAPIASKHRDRALLSAVMMNKLVKDWNGNNKVDIAKANGLSLKQLSNLVTTAAKIAGCEGEPDIEIRG